MICQIHITSPPNFSAIWYMVQCIGWKLPTLTKLLYAWITLLVAMMAGWCSQYCTSMGGIRQTGIRCQNYKTKAEWQTGPISWSIPCGGETSTQARNGQLRLYKLASYNIELFWLTWYLVCTVIYYISFVTIAIIYWLEESFCKLEGW